MASKTIDEAGQPAQSSSEFATRQSALFSEGFSFSGYERDLVCLNLGDGTFVDISGISGADSVSDGRAAVRADFDNDGDLDIFLRAVHGRAHFLFRNRIGQDNNWVRVALRGTAGTRDAYGSIVRLKTRTGTTAKIKAGGSGFLSQSDPRLLFGLGDEERAEWIEVTWPSGETKRYPGPVAGSSVLIVEDEGTPRPIDEQLFSLPEPLSQDDKMWNLVEPSPGERLPRLVVESLAHGKMVLDDLIEAGRPAVVNFWATWCRNCAREMPVLQRLAASDVQVIGLSVDDEVARKRIPAFLDRLGVDYPVATIEPEELDRLFTSRDLAIPISLVLDGDGALRAILQGWSGESEERLAKILSSLD